MKKKISLGLILSFAIVACASKSVPPASPPQERSCKVPQIREGFEVYEASKTKVAKSRKVTIGSEVYYLVGAPIVSSKDFVSVTESPSPGELMGFGSNFAYFVEVNADATKRLADSTLRMKGKHMVIVQDGQALSAPIVQGTIEDGRFAYSAPMTKDGVKVSEFERFCLP
jgi:preprotein translocase subunit SecD